MPPLPLPLLDCAVYLYTDRPAAEDSEKFGGSGFVVWVPIKGRPDGGTAYVVTNRHVGPKFPAIRFNTRDGETDIQTAGIWHEHSEADLAVAEVTLAPAHQTARIPLDLFLSEADRSWYQVGTETASVGRFVKHDGKQRNTPVVRFGNIAMLPGEPVQVDGNLPAQVGFLVESRSIPGYSGSPVFAYFPHPHTSGAELRSPPIAGISTRLLGVTWGHIRDNVKVEGSTPS